MWKQMKSWTRSFKILLIVILCFVLVLLKNWFYGSRSGLFNMEYQITKTWNDQQTGHDPIKITLRPESTGLKIQVNAPFFNDPKNPGGRPGETFPGLWEYEVVEAFFLTDDHRYLEVELCPHGQHLVLLLNGYRKMFKDNLPLAFISTIAGQTWHGEAFIPANYFPRKVTQFNAYAIHGSGDQRVYEALYPVPQNKYDSPDFHRLDYFQPLPFDKLLPSNAGDSYKSEEWDV